MVEEAAEAGRESALRDAKAELDERRIARAVAIGLPVVTVTFALAAGLLVGAAQAILILAAGVLLGVIALFWASLRVLSGDAALSPELEALDATAHAVDAMASRKKMLVRALKDLDNERALGKLEDEDYEQLSHTYRAELKEVLRRIDASLEPHRSKAEDAALAYLAKSELAKQKPRKVEAPSDSRPAVPDAHDDEDEVEEAEEREDAKPAPAPTRVTCSACQTSNEIDASFCKRCGASLAKDASHAKDAAQAASADKDREVADET